MHRISCPLAQRNSLLPSLSQLDFQMACLKEPMRIFWRVVNKDSLLFKIQRCKTWVDCLLPLQSSEAKERSKLQVRGKMGWKFKELLLSILSKSHLVNKKLVKVSKQEWQPQTRESNQSLKRKQQSKELPLNLSIKMTTCKPMTTKTAI